LLNVQRVEFKLYSGEDKADQYLKLIHKWRKNWSTRT